MKANKNRGLPAKRKTKPADGDKSFLWRPVIKAEGNQALFSSPLLYVPVDISILKK